MQNEEHGHQKGDETAEGRLSNDLSNLVAQWEELGIDPDDFLKCGKCHKWFRDLTEGTDPPIAEEDYCTCEQ